MDYYYHWLRGSVGNANQILAAHSSVVYESVDSQEIQPLPQNMTGIPVDRNGMMNPGSCIVWFIAEGQRGHCCLPSNTNPEPLGARIAEDRRKEWGSG